MVQGKIAGRNAETAENNDSVSFHGIAASAITKVFDLFVGSTGLRLQDAKDEGYDSIEQIIEGKTRVGYYRYNKPVWISVIEDKNGSRLLGAQIIGGEEVKGRIDQVVLALLQTNVRYIANYD